MGCTFHDSSGDDPSNGTRFTAADVGVFVNHNPVKSSTEQTALRDEIIVSTVAGSGIDGCAILVRKRPNRSTDLLECSGVVPVIDDDCRALKIEQVEPSWRASTAARKTFQTHSYQLQRYSQTPGRSGTGQHILYLKADHAAVHERHPVEVGQPRLTRTVTEHNPAVPHRRGQASRGQMLDNNRIGRVECKIDDLPLAPFFHIHDQWIGSIEDSRPLLGNGGNNRALHPRQPFGRIDFAKTEMVSRTDIRNNGNIAGVEATTLAQNAAAGGLQHSRRNRRIGKHAPRTHRATAITSLNLSCTNPNSLCACRPHSRTTGGRQMGKQPHDGCFPVGTRNGSHGNPAIVSRSKQRIDDRSANITRCANRRLQMHPQPWSSVHLNHNTTLGFKRMPNISRNNIDTCDIQADDPGSLDGPRCHIWVHVIGHIFGRATGAQVGILPQQDDPIQAWHAFWRKPLLCQDGHCHLVDDHRTQRRCVVSASTGVLIDAID